MNDIEKQIQELRRARDAGLLTEDTYQAALKGLGVEVDPQRESAKTTNISDSQAGVVGDNAHINGDIHIDESQHVQGGVVVLAKNGAKVIVPQHSNPASDDNAPAAILNKYLTSLITQNLYLQLQGIRSGGRLVHIELDRIYITLRIIRQREPDAEQEWLAAQSSLAPGENVRLLEDRVGESMAVSVNQALAGNKRLVVLGDPGSGKTTLLRYLTLLYGRDLQGGTTLVKDKLELAESGYLPVFIPLRKIGAFLKATPEDGTGGHALLLEFMLRCLHNERIVLEMDFFDEWLQDGRAVILLDGLDEVADPKLRRRVSHLVDAFTRAYPRCRYVVTSRIVG